MMGLGKCISFQTWHHFGDQFVNFQAGITKGILINPSLSTGILGGALLPNHRPRKHTPPGFTNMTGWKKKKHEWRCISFVKNRSIFPFSHVTPLIFSTMKPTNHIINGKQIFPTSVLGVSVLVFSGFHATNTHFETFQKKKPNHLPRTYHLHHARTKTIYTQTHLDGCLQLIFGSQATTSGCMIHTWKIHFLWLITMVIISPEKRSGTVGALLKHPIGGL